MRLIATSLHVYRTLRNAQETHESAAAAEDLEGQCIYPRVGVVVRNDRCRDVGLN